MTPRAASLLHVPVLAALFLWLQPSWAMPPLQPNSSVLHGRLDRAQRVPEPATPQSRVEGDELWWDGFGLPSTDGYIFSAIEFQGSVIIAGQFSRVGNVRANGIARWNGTTWEPIGTGIEWGYPHCLRVHNGDLIVGGNFHFAGGVHARSIARWNGSQWFAFGVGIHDGLTNPIDVVDITSLGDTLVALAQDWSPSMSRILLWSGTEWVPLVPATSNWIRCLASLDGSLYAGGQFQEIDGIPVSHIARWDGSTWSDVGGGVELSWGPAQAMTLFVHGMNLIVGGMFDSAGGAPAQGFAVWDGTAWTTLGSGLGEVPSAFAVKQDTLYVGYGNGIARWNGQDWDFPAPPLFGTPASLVFWGNDLIVAGSIMATNAGSDRPAALAVTRLSGGTWHPLMDLTDHMHGLAGYGGDWAQVQAVAAYRGKILASGNFRYAGAPPHWAEIEKLAEWDGTQWTRLEPTNSTPSLNIHSLVVDGNDLYVGGSDYLWLPSDYVPAYRFDGNEWHSLPGGPRHVTVLAMYGGRLHAVGHSDSLPESHVYRWDETTWKTIGTVRGSGFALIRDMVEHEGRLVIVGRFTSVEGVPAANVAAWDGAGWQPIGAGLPSHPQQSIVQAVEVFQGHLVAAGDAIAASPLGSTVARWSGSTWKPMGGRIGSAYTLGSVGGELFVSGLLREGDDFEHPYHLARWSGTSWVRVGSGVNGPVTSFAALENSIYMGGSFSEAGGKASFAIARWDGIPAQLGTRASFRTASPNPFRSSTGFAYTLPTSGTVRISVHDVHGREIAVLQNGIKNAGIHHVDWSGQDRHGQSLPSGVYFVRALMPDGVEQTRKTVLVR